MFQLLIVIYRRGNFCNHFCNHYWGCTSIYRPLSYPFRPLQIMNNVIPSCISHPYCPNICRGGILIFIYFKWKLNINSWQLTFSLIFKEKINKSEIFISGTEIKKFVIKLRTFILPILLQFVVNNVSYNK